MDKSITETFLEKLLKPFKDPETIEDALDLAEKRHADIKGMIRYIKEDKSTKIPLLGDGMAVDNAIGYINALNDYAMKLGQIFHDLRPETEDPKTYQKLSEICHTFEYARDEFSNYITRHDPAAQIPSSKVHLGYLRSITKTYEPDTRPKAEIIPIHPGIDIDG